jgi:hypothetical protein
MAEDKIKKQKEDEQLKDEQLDEVNGGRFIKDKLSNI